MMLKKGKNIRILKPLLIWFSFCEEDPREMSGIMDTAVWRRFYQFYALFWSLLSSNSLWNILARCHLHFRSKLAGSIRGIGEIGPQNRKSPFSPFSNDFSGKTVMNEILGLDLLNMMSVSKIQNLQSFVHYREKTGRKKVFHSIVPAKLSAKLLPKPNS